MWWDFTDISNWFDSSESWLANFTSFHCLPDVITNSWPKYTVPCFKHTFIHTLVSFMDLFQHFLSQCGRYKKSGTLGCKPIFDRYVFPKVLVQIKFLWKLPSFTRPSNINVVHQKFDCRVFPSFLMDYVQFIWTVWNVHCHKVDCNDWQLNFILFHG